MHSRDHADSECELYFMWR